MDNAAEIIDGYRLRSLLQTGQTSQVYEVVEVNSNRHFAMKLLLPESARNPEHRKLLIHEAEVGKLLTHPNVIRITKLNRSQTNPYFVMEYFPSGSLRTRMMLKQNDFIREHTASI